MSPCSGSSRWLKIESGACTAPTASSPSTQTLATAIENATDVSNANIRDITVSSGTCSDHVGVTVDADGACWQHVHPHMHNVYDLSYWVGKHDGNVLVAQSNGANPISKVAEAGLVDFAFPASQPLVLAP